MDGCWFCDLRWALLCGRVQRYFAGLYVWPVLSTCTARALRERRWGVRGCVTRNHHQKPSPVMRGGRVCSFQIEQPPQTNHTGCDGGLPKLCVYLVWGVLVRTKSPCQCLQAALLLLAFSHSSLYPELPGAMALAALVIDNHPFRHG